MLNGNQANASMAIPTHHYLLDFDIYPVQVDELYHKGAQYYIQKPTDFKKLTRVIEQLLLMSEEQRQVQPAKKDFILCRER